MNQNALARASAERKSLDSMASGAVVVVVAAVAVVVVAIDSFPADLRDDVDPPSLALPSSDEESGAGAFWGWFNVEQMI